MRDTLEKKWSNDSTEVTVANPGDESWYWLSFCDPDRPAGTQFLGVAIVGPASLGIEAVALAHRLGCNPGGEVAWVEFPDELARHVPEGMRCRLLSRAEVEQVDEAIGDARAGVRQ